MCIERADLTSRCWAVSVTTIANLTLCWLMSGAALAQKPNAQVTAEVSLPRSTFRVFEPLVLACGVVNKSSKTYEFRLGVRNATLEQRNDQGQ